MNCNNHITQYLNYFLGEIEEAPKYAVLIKGGWGSGKTHYIDQYFKNSIVQDEHLGAKVTREHIKISLYGISDTSAIDDLIFEKIHPVLASKQLEVIGKVAKGLLKFGFKIDLNNNGKDETFSPVIPDIKLQEYLKKFNEKCIVFDDLERCSIPISELLGYFNYFVEHLGKKVILIANEEEIDSVIGTESEKEQKKYFQIKEKVIGKVFTITSAPTNVIPHIIEASTTKKKSRDFVNTQLQLCIETFNTVRLCKDKEKSHCNYRAFGHVIREFDFLFGQMSEPFRQRDDKNYEKVMVNFFHQYVLFGYALQCGYISADDFKNYGTDTGKLENESTFDAINRNNKRIERLKSDHNLTDELFQSNNKFTMVFWLRIFVSHSITVSEIEVCLRKDPLFWNNVTPEYEKLPFYWRLDDDQFEQALSTTIENVITRTYDIPILLSAYHSFLSISAWGIRLPIEIGNSAEEIIDKAKENLFAKIHESDFDNVNHVKHEIQSILNQFPEHPKGYLEFQNTFFDLLDTVECNRMVTDVETLLSDWQNFRSKIERTGQLFTPDQLKKLDIKKFMDAFSSFPNFGKNRTILSFKNRWGMIHVERDLEILISDRDFYQKLSEYIVQNYDATEVDSISKRYIMQLKTEVADTALEMINITQPENESSI